MRTEIDIIIELIKYVPVVGVLGWWIYSLKQQSTSSETLYQKREDDLLTKLDTSSKDYKKLAEDAIKVITLADDKLRQNNNQSDTVKDIHRIVKELNSKIK
jgi:hypothetical protein